MEKPKPKVSRRRFLQGTAAGVAAITIVPRNVLGRGETAPSDQLNGALIGCGGRGGGTFGCLGGNVKRVADCDVKFKDKVDNNRYYTDFRVLLERKDIDVVAIATPPGWHALISIAAMEAGKDVVCEKPMCRFIAEGRKVAEAEKRFGRIFQIERKGPYDYNKMRKIFESGLLKNCDSILVKKGGFKVKQWSGMVRHDVTDVPSNLDWDMYCGPAPLRSYNRHRTGGTHRGYWDLEGGGLADMAHHHLHGLAFQFGRDLSAPVEVTPYAPPQHPECVAMWGWCEMKYADGFTLVLESGEWGDPYPKPSQKLGEGDLLAMLSEEDRKKIDEMPDKPRDPMFEEAVKTRVPTASTAERSQRVATIYHLANVSFRVGRPFKFDPDTEQVIGDDEANRLVNQPMRAPWRL